MFFWFAYVLLLVHGNLKIQFFRIWVTFCRKCSKNGKKSFKCSKKLKYAPPCYFRPIILNYGITRKGNTVILSETFWFEKLWYSFFIWQIRKKYSIIPLVSFLDITLIFQFRFIQYQKFIFSDFFVNSSSFFLLSVSYQLQYSLLLCLSLGADVNALLINVGDFFDSSLFLEV